MKIFVFTGYEVALMYYANIENVLDKNDEYKYFYIPETGKHPEQQIEFARDLVREIKASSCHFAVVTHSDYIIKELNNCLMLSNDFLDKEEFMREYGYEQHHILHPDEIEVYIGTEKVELGKFGMKKSAFDDAIKRFNEISDILYNIIG